MAEKTLAQKLGMKPGQRILVLNAPETVQAQLESLPPESTLTSLRDGDTFDAALVFMADKAQVDAEAGAVVKAVKRDGLLWFAYPKKTSKIKTDITRDIGWEAVWTQGLSGIAMISIDDTWSAMRFRPSDLVKRKGT